MESYSYAEQHHIATRIATGGSSIMDEWSLPGQSCIVIISSVTSSLVPKTWPMVFVP